MHLLPENIVDLAVAATQRLSFPLLNGHGIVLDVLRLDKIHPVISGNKWFKLKYYLEDALQNGQQRVLSFGGAWSNHIVATACAAEKIGLQSIGIIRGERPAVLPSALLKARDQGMQLVFVSRQVYNQKKDPAFIEQLRQQYDHPCIIPEGGEGEKGVSGAAEILQLAAADNYTHLACAVGTGTLLSGLVLGALPHQQIIGIPVLQGFDNWLPQHMDIKKKHSLHILPRYHMGGYAKKNAVLLNFMNEFYRETNIPTDFVYTGKLFFSIIDLVKKDYFPKGARILAIHSGGLQGNDSLAPGTLVF